MLTPKDYNKVHALQKKINSLYEKQDNIIESYFHKATLGTIEQIEELIKELPFGFVRNLLQEELIRRKGDY